MTQWMALVGLLIPSLAGFIVIVNYYWLLKRQKKPPNRRPLEVLYPDTEKTAGEVEVDIIAVHGLGADVDKAWTWKHGSKRVNWLKDGDMLPSFVDKARIIVYNYDSAWHADAPKTRLQLRGEALVRHIHSLRSGNTGRPILFIGHSLGGLVIEYALLFAKDQPKFRYLLEQTVGCVFLGTPFRGSKTQRVAYFAAKMMSFARSSTGIIRDLVYDSPVLRDVLQSFCQLKEDFSIPIFCFFEGRPTDYGRKIGIPHVFVQTVVEEASACIDGQGRMELQVDHIMLNKFAGPQDPSFMSIASLISGMHNNMGEVLNKRKAAGRKTAPFIVPFQRNRNFVGRASIVHHLLERADPDASTEYCHRTAIVGLGGVGKTQVALEAVYRIHSLRPAHAVFWVSAEDKTSFENDYREIGRELNVKGADTDADIKQLVKDALSDDGAAPFLLVIDNADDAKLLLENGHLSLDRYLPSRKKSSIIFTTRSYEAAVDLVDSPTDDIFRLDEMNDAEALQLLATGLKDEQMRDTEKTLDLLTFLANLPLAIKQASTFIAKKQMSTARYLYWCRRSDESMIELLSRDFEDRYEHVKYPITTTWFISFRHISELDPLAADYLKFACFISPKDIPRSLFPSATSLKAEKALGTLKAYSFFTERAGRESYDVHQLVQMAVRGWLRAEKEWKSWERKSLLQMNKSFPFPEHENREVWKQYLPHAECILRPSGNGIPGNEGSGRDLLLKTGESLRILGKYEEAEAIQRRSLVMHEEELGLNHPATLTSMDNLGLTLRRRGKYKDAETMHYRTLSIRREVLGCDDPDTLISLDNLGLALLGQGRYEEAEEMHRRALSSRKTVLGHNHLHTLASMHNLAIALRRQGGEYEEAEVLHRQALILCAELLGCRHPYTLTIMAGLGLVLRRQGKDEDAEEMHRRVLALYEEVLGNNHPTTLITMNNLGLVLRRRAKYEEAEDIHRRALGLKEKVLGYMHPTTLVSMNNLGLVLGIQGKYGDAEAVHRRALALRATALGHDDPHTKESVVNLVRVLGCQGKYQEARLVREVQVSSET